MYFLIGLYLHFKMFSLGCFTICYMSLPSESFILHSWNHNAHRWNELIEGEKLESRRLVTNKAIVEVLSTLSCNQILDVGCGEGWLVRRMNEQGRECRGIDGSSTLIQLAQSKGQGIYQCLNYGEITQGESIEGTPFNTIVLNFALFTQGGTAELLSSLLTHLVPQGKLVIQSLHPGAISDSQEGRWEPDVWQGLPGDFTHTYAWYLRSMEEWKSLFEDCQLRIEEIHEPAHPHTQRPLSIIFVLSAQQAKNK